MGYYVEMTVIIQASHSMIAAEAREYLKKYLRKYNVDDPDPDVVNFLKHLSMLTEDMETGPKGDIVTWGQTGNYSIPEMFIEELEDFWYELFKKGICCGNNIVILTQGEYDETVIAHQIKWFHEKEQPGYLIVRQYKCQFSLRCELGYPPSVDNDHDDDHSFNSYLLAVKDTNNE